MAAGSSCRGGAVAFRQKAELQSYDDQFAELRQWAGFRSWKSRRESGLRAQTIGRIAEPSQGAGLQSTDSGRGCSCQRKVGFQSSGSRLGCRAHLVGGVWELCQWAGFVEL